MRRKLLAREVPPPDAVRVEEFVNYFRYDYAAPPPGGPVPFAIAVSATSAPWAPAHRIVRVTLKGRELAREALPAANLVFLLDVSGSMDEPDRLPLVKDALRVLVQQLRPVDRVAIVVYAGAAGLVLPSTAATGSGKRAILGALDRLEAGGSTAGGEGLRLAYNVAEQAFIRGGTNRIVLATDGDFNVGESSDGAMFRLVEERRASGVALTVLGFGMGNLKDGRLEQMADRGNGNYAYVDDLLEARRVLVGQFAGTLVTIAKDVKVQVEWNPRAVQAYRLIGYDNRRLAAEDFADDRKDAGELGVGHTVTALYEIVPAGVQLDSTVAADTTALRYTEVRPTAAARAASELGVVRLRYKAPAAARAETALGADPEGERAEFVRLMREASRLEVAGRAPH